MSGIGKSIGVSSGLNGFSWMKLLFLGLDRPLLTPVVPPPATPAVVER